MCSVLGLDSLASTIGQKHTDALLKEAQDGCKIPAIANRRVGIRWACSRTTGYDDYERVRDERYYKKGARNGETPTW